MKFQKLVLINSIVTLALFIALPLFASQEAKMEIHEYGIFDVPSGGENTENGHEIIMVRSLNEIVNLKKTNKIPLLLGVKFGVKYTIKSLQEGQETKVTVVIDGPIIGYKGDPDKKEPIYFKEKWSSVKKNNVVTYDGFEFEVPSELIEGKWTFSFYDDYKNLLAEKVFKIYKPGIFSSYPREKKAFDEASKQRTVAPLQNFLIKFPDGIFRERAKSQIIDMTLYKQVQKAGDYSSYSNYLKWFPEGLYNEIAMAKLAEFDYEFYNYVDTHWGYDSFINKHPNSKFSKEIQKKRERLIYPKVMKSLSITVHEKYLAEFPEAVGAEQVRVRLDLLNNDLAQLKQNVIDETHDEYTHFLEQYPENSYAPLVKGIVAALAEKQVDAKHKPLVATINKNTANEDVCTLYLKNMLNSSLTLRFSGLEIFSVSFAPGEAGSVQLKSGYYTVSILSEKNQGLSFSGSMEFNGRLYLHTGITQLRPTFFGIGQTYAGGYLLGGYASQIYYTGGYFTKSPDITYQNLKKKNEEAKELSIVLGSLDKKLGSDYPLKRTPDFDNPFGASRVKLDHVGTLNVGQGYDGGGYRNVKYENFGRESFRQSQNIISQISPRLVKSLASKDVWQAVALLREYYAEPGKSVESQISRSLGPTRGWESPPSDIHTYLISEDKSVTNTMVQALQYCNDNVWAKSIPILAQSGYLDENLYLNFIRSPNAQLKYEVVTALVYAGTSQAVLPLLEILQNEKHPFIRENALRAITEIAKRETIDVEFDKDSFLKLLSVVPSYEKWLGFVQAIPRTKFSPEVLRQVHSRDLWTRRLILNIMALDPLKSEYNYFIDAIEEEDEVLVRAGILGLATLKDERAIKPLFKLHARTDNKGLKSEALVALGQIDSISVFDELTKMLKLDPHNKSILKAFSVQGSTNAADSLVQLLTEDEQADYIEASDAFAGIGAAAVPALVAVADLSDYQFKSRIIRILRAIPDDSACRALLVFAEDDSQYVRKEAIMAIRFNELTYQKREYPEFLIDTLINNESMAAMIVSDLGHYRGKHPLAIAKLEAAFLQGLKDGVVRYEILKLLSRWDAVDVLPEAVPLLARKLADPQVDKWRTILDALGQIGDKASAELLVTELGQVSGDFMQKHAVLSAITKTKQAFVIPKVLQGLKETADYPDGASVKELRRAYIRTLKGLGFNEEIPFSYASGEMLKKSTQPLGMDHFASMLKHGDIKAKEKAIWTLAGFKDKSAIKLLESAYYEEPQVAARAVRALVSFGDAALPSLRRMLKKASTEKEKKRLLYEASQIVEESGLDLQLEYYRKGIDTKTGTLRLFKKIHPEFLIGNNS